MAVPYYNFIRRGDEEYIYGTPFNPPGYPLYLRSNLAATQNGTLKSLLNSALILVRGELTWPCSKIRKHVFFFYLNNKRRLVCMYRI